MTGFFGYLWKMALSGQVPTKRAVNALAHLGGLHLRRKWPYVVRAGLGPPPELRDFLELQQARCSIGQALVVGAFDGATNDPTFRFIAERNWRALYVEPQPGPFEALVERTRSRPRISAVNAAVDSSSGTRTMYVVNDPIGKLPAWTAQLASFDKEHILKHEELAPGLAQCITSREVQTFTFEHLLNEFNILSLDLLQIDAEGCDALLLGCFPYHLIRPWMIYYETAHMSHPEYARVVRLLTRAGYRIFRSESMSDDIALRCGK